MPRLFDCLCLMSPMFAMMLAASCGIRAWKKGYSGLLFGMLFGFVCLTALMTGCFAAMAIVLSADPSKPKDDVAASIALGGVIGGSFGMALMSLVTRLLPDRFAPDEDVPNPELSDA